MAILTITEAACKGCGLCINACPKKKLALDTSRVNAKGYNPVLCPDTGGCTACGICARVCPDSVIKVERGDAA
jgi:2-oxoglutarate ferredoxin oxidoreductase subunit delta